MTTTILALDLATATGWACRDPLGRITSGVKRFDLGRGESPGMRFLRFRRWLLDCWGPGHAPAVIAYERAHHRGGAATQLCVGLQAIVLEHAALVGAETAPVHTAALKKLATGSGRADKSAMIAAARAKWPSIEVLDDNHADALWVLEWARREVGA